MGTGLRSIILFLTVYYCCASLTIASEDVEFKDPYLVEVATFAATNLLKNLNELGLKNTSTLLRIMDAHIVPFTQPTPTQYMLTVELGSDCSGNGTCKGGKHICEVNVLDEPWVKKHVMDDDKTKCADREPNVPLDFIDTSSTIASSLAVDDAATRALATKAVAQMGVRRGGKHTLIHLGQARKVMMEDTNSNLYYLSLYISTTNENVVNEVCEVTMEEALTSKEQTLQSLRCFTTGDNEGADKMGIMRVPPEELTSSLIRHAVLASLAIIDAESTSQFQLKVIGYSLTDSRMSADSGTRDLQLKLGLVPTLCIKHADSDDDEEDTRSCTIDIERDPSMCSITLTQWPWVSDGYLFSDFNCDSTNYDVISEDLEAYTDEDSASSEEGSEVEEVTSNAVQNSNRRENVEEEEEEEEEGKEVDEVSFVARRGQCYGCATEIDAQSPKVKEMAVFALSALENAVNSDKVLSVARVEKATSQVVSGRLYMLTIEVVETDCARAENADRSKCTADESNGKRRTCTVGIWDQPWLNSKQIREPNCDVSNLEIESRSLKTVSVSGQRETTPLSPDDEEVKNVAVFALSRLDAFDDNSKKRLLVRVIEATSHSVARSRTYNARIQVALSDCAEGSGPSDPECLAALTPSTPAYFCDIQVLAQSGGEKFVPKRLVDSKCFPVAPADTANGGESDKKDLTGEGSENRRVPAQQQQLVGGHEATDTSSPYVQSMAQFATSAINQRSNGNHLKLIRVLRSASQVVAGKKVTLDVEVGYTNCTKTHATGGNCLVDDSEASVICHVIIWDRPWLNDRRVTNMTCESLALLESSTSEPAVDPDIVTPPIGDFMSADIEAYADFALAVVEEQSNADEKLKVTKILASSVQIVQGKNVRLSLEIGTTTCKKEDTFSEECPIDEAKGAQICNIQIWDRLQEKQVTDLNCHPRRAKPGERKTRSEDFDESPFVGEAPKSFRLGSGVELIPKSSRSESKPNVPLLGAYAVVDPKDPVVLEIADFATTSVSQSLNSESPNSAPYALVKVHSAEKQIVAGVNYKLELELSRPEGSLLCNVFVFDQSWTSTRRVTSMTCFPAGFPSAPEKPKWNAALFRPVSVGDAAVKDVASFAVSAMSKPNAFVSLVKVNAAARQSLDDETNYKLTLQVLKAEGTTICDVVVAQKACQLTLSSCRDPKRRRQLDGGYRAADVNDATVKEMADFAASAIGQATNADSLNVAKIVSAETQIVSGKNYKLTIELIGAAGKQTCNAVVYRQSWTKTRQLSSFQCKDPSGSRTSRQRSNKVRGRNSELSIQPPLHCIGGFCPVDPNEAAVVTMANFAATALSSSMNSGALTLAKVRSAERQVVAGFNYRLELELNVAGGTIICKVVVFDQSWTSTRVITNSECLPASLPPRRKPPPPPPTTAAAVPAQEDDSSEMEQVGQAPMLNGAYSAADPEDPTVKEMATFAAATISESSNGEPFSLLRVVSAQKQIVSGINYKLRLELGGKTRVPHTCEAVVYDQSWTKTRKLSSFNCIPNAPVLPDSDATFSAVGTPQLGAYLDISPEDDSAQELAVFATNLLSLSLNAGPLKLARVASASKQVTGGGNYQLALELSGEEDVRFSCDVVVYDVENARQLTYSNCKSSSRRRRSAEQITGGRTPIDPQSQKIKELADFAVTAINIRSNEPTIPSAVRVLKASQQVVSGMMYHLDIELGYTDCPQESCTRVQKCIVSIWEQPWLQKCEVAKLDCKEGNKEKKSLRDKPTSRRLGGLKPADPSSDYIKTQAAFALQAIQAQSNSKNSLDIVHIKRAVTQTVSGKKIFLTLEIGQTKCDKLNQSNKNCTIDEQAEHQICKVEIWTRPWLDERQVTDLKCAPITVNKRFGRSTDGHHNHHKHHSKNLQKVRRLKHMKSFRAYSTKFNKVYQTWDEFERRYKIYRANQEKIELLNKYEMGTAVYGDTPFSDWSSEEYKSHLAGFRPLLRQSSNRLTKAIIPQVDLPDTFDWRDHNVVTPVKNQGSCGSCWAFSATGNVEGVYGVRKGELLSLSEQELVDCDKLDSGCNGGLPENAYKAIKDLGGLETESDYPYNGHQNTCSFNSNITRVQVTGGVEISTNETEMAQWLVKNGPISIGINANAMQFYRGGVSHPWKVLCRPGGIDHGVLIVGYGTSDYPKFNKTLPYWIVKNSWGTSWGEQGYYRVFRGDGTCGINKMCTSAVIE